MIKATQALVIQGLTILQRISDPLRLCTIYATDDGNLVIGFGGTMDNLADWIANVQPHAEASSLYIHVAHWIRVYQPSKVTLVGYSQGGAHAEIIARHIDAEVVTFGGLPAGGVGTHYLVRSDPMAWLPVRRKGVVIKLGKRVLWPSFKGHEIDTYLEELECLSSKT